MIRVRRWDLAFLLVSSAVLASCSMAITKPAPPQTKRIAVSFESKQLSGWSDLPPGCYRVPDSQVIISGHQKGGAAGVLFGVIGVAIQSSVNASSGHKATAGLEDALRLDLTAQEQRIARESLEFSPFKERFTLEPDASATQLSVSTALIATYVTDTDVRPYVVLKVTLTEPKSDHGSTGKQFVWTTRYIASVGAPRALSGSGSWTEAGGQPLKDAAEQSLRRAIKVMLTDIAQPYPRDKQKLTTVEGGFPFVKKRLQTVGYELVEDDQSLVFVPKLSSAIVFSGVNIMDKAAIQYRPATKEDRKLKVMDEAPARAPAAHAVAEKKP